MWTPPASPARTHCRAHTQASSAVPASPAAADALQAALVAWASPARTSAAPSSPTASETRDCQPAWRARVSAWSAVSTASQTKPARGTRSLGGAPPKRSSTDVRLSAAVEASANHTRTRVAPPPRPRRGRSPSTQQRANSVCSDRRRRVPDTHAGRRARSGSTAAAGPRNEMTSAPAYGATSRHATLTMPRLTFAGAADSRSA
mmetsp:Transcript_9450/g.25820  ORF Transcript_9450/g.25820 Transcript_9450/m.25820 type:complete len:203 (-) Transcript_9450:1377-1985(-)